MYDLPFIALSEIFSYQVKERLRIILESECGPQDPGVYASVRDRFIMSNFICKNIEKLFTLKLIFHIYFDAFD